MLEGVGCRGQSSSVTLCFLTVDGMSGAAPCSCHHAFPCRDGLHPLELQARINLSFLKFLARHLIPEMGEVAKTQGPLAKREQGFPGTWNMRV